MHRARMGPARDHIARFRARDYKKAIRCACCDSLFIRRDRTLLMSREPDYACDEEFLKLLTRRPEVDLTRVSLELARDAYPDMEFGPTLSWLEERAQEIAGPIARARCESDA